MRCGPEEQLTRHRRPRQENLVSVASTRLLRPGIELSDKTTRFRDRRGIGALFHSS